MSNSTAGWNPTPHSAVSLRVLLIDDAPAERLRARRAIELRMEGVALEEVESVEEFTERLQVGGFDAVITEFTVGWSNGLDILRAVTRRWPEVPVIMVTSSGSEAVCAEGLRSGLHDYLVKGPDLEVHLALALRGARDLIEARRVVRKRSQSLEESEQRFRTMADTAPVLIWLASAGRARTWVNRPWLEFTGRSLQQELGEGWIAGIHPDDRRTSLDSYRRAFREVRPFRVEYRLARRDGQYRWVLDSGTPRFEGGRLAGYVGSVIDITDRRQTEEIREQLLASETNAREQAEAAGRVKDEFLTTLSHDLRTPVESILASVRRLRAETPSASELERCLEKIERDATAQAELIENLLDLSRIISGTFRLQMQWCDPVELIESAAASVETAAAARGIELRRRSQPIGVVMVDPPRITQIVWNLLSNAIKFTSRGGLVEIELVRTGDLLEISVSDTGIGIAPEFLPFVFDRFRQSRGSAEHGGVGVGLSIAKHLAEAHGGTIRAHSDGPCCGAKFHVTIPAIEPIAIEQLPSLRAELKAGRKP